MLFFSAVLVYRKAVNGDSPDQRWLRHLWPMQCVRLAFSAVCVRAHECPSVSELTFLCFTFAVIMLFGRGVSPWLVCSDVQQWERLWDRHHRRPHITPLGAVCTEFAELWPQACGVNWFSQVAIAGEDDLVGWALKTPMSWWTPLNHTTPGFQPHFTGKKKSNTFW